MSSHFTRLGEGHLVLQTRWLAVREYEVERRGVAGRYSVVERPDSTIVIPITSTHRTVLLKQFRFPTGEDSWELPMGGVEPTEDPEAAARRELMEEVGLRARDLVKIGEYRAAPGLSPQKVTVFTVNVTDEELESSAATWASSDDIQDVRIVDLRGLAAMIRQGAVTDGFSLSGVLLLHLWLDE